ncbi:unnamed protein product, partial [Oppiella nova]
MNRQFCRKKLIPNGKRLSLMSRHVLHMIATKNNTNVFIERHITTESTKLRQYDSYGSAGSADTSGGHKRMVRNGRVLQTHYDVLKISRTATQKDIKTAYYSLSKSCHPDLNKTSEATQQFQEITEAYDVLANKDTKQMYDMKIGNHFRANGAGDGSEHHRQNHTINTMDTNQQNLNSFRDFNRFSDGFRDTDDYTQTAWRRRTRKKNLFTEDV